MSGYLHTRTFFQHARWDAHDFLGTLMARGITQFQVAIDGADITRLVLTEPDPKMASRLRGAHLVEAAVAVEHHVATGRGLGDRGLALRRQRATTLVGGG